MEIITTTILLLLLCATFFINRSKHQHIIALSSTFIAYWFAVVFFSGFHFYGLFDISTDVYLLVISGTFSFLLGYCLVNNKKNDKKQLDIKKTKSLKFNFLFYSALVFAFILIIKQVILLLPLIMMYGMSEARGEMQVDQTLVLTGALDVLISYFAKPFVKAAIIVLVVNSFKERFNYKTIFLIVVLLGAYFLSEGGRAVIMDIFFIFVYMLYTSQNVLNRKTKRRIRNSIIILALMPILATIERGGDDMFYAIYTYYCGSLQYLSQAMQTKADVFNEHLFGVTCFQGFIKPITSLLNLVGFEKPKVIQGANDFIMIAQTTVYEIAPNCYMNYFFTSFGYAYKDGGFVGNIIIHFIYGVMCKYVDVKERIKFNSIRWKSIKTSFFCCVLFTMSYFPYAIYLHSMTILYIVLITSGIFSSYKNDKIS